jgi:hypothetical protein
MTNTTAAPIDRLHVRFQDSDLAILRLAVPDTTLEQDDAPNRYRIYRFNTPLAPGATTTLDFHTRRWQQG